MLPLLLFTASLGDRYYYIDFRNKETENKMAGWHHQTNGHEFEQTPGDSEGQGSLVSCSPWGRKKSDTTEQLN